MALDEIVRLGVREQPRRSLPGAIADLLSFTR